MTKPVVTIRRACHRDLEALTRLLELLFGIEEDFTFDPAVQLRGLRLMLEHTAACILVAEIESRVIGMCSGQLTISTAEGGPSVLVEDMVVEEKWQGQGVGRQLLAGIAQWGAEHKTKRLQLLADRQNKAALDFYARLGWERTQLICLRRRQE